MKGINTYIGIDLGTSSVKLLLADAGGRVLKSVTREYPVYYPQSGWSEQNPSDWYANTTEGIKNLLEGFDKSSVKGISFGGQMHGLVALDKNGEVIRPAILWNDGRTQKQTDYLNNVIGKAALSEMTANIAFAGFTAPKILWMKENEPGNFARIAKILLPKDYISYRLCGKYSTDMSDASGTLLLDVKNRKWSEKMCSICGVKPEWLPELYESYEAVGEILPEIARETGLNNNARIVAGAGDNAAAAIGTGTVGGGACNISLGTSGTVFISSKDFSVDKQNALHSFCHADGSYHSMGCMLSAAACNRWWVQDILGSDYIAERRDIDKYMGKNEVFFLPYLMGERSPHNDVNARGAFIGMGIGTCREKMSLAVMEGVAFALKECMEVAGSNGIKIERTKICGGGAKNPVWIKIIANILDIPVDIPEKEEGPAYGGAILAMAGCGEYKSVEEISVKFTKISGTVFPSRDIAKKYETKYIAFKRLYRALKKEFEFIGGTE